MKLKQKSQYGGGGLTSKDGLRHLFSECSFFREEGLKSNHNLQKRQRECIWINVCPISFSAWSPFAILSAVYQHIWKHKTFRNRKLYKMIIIIDHTFILMKPSNNILPIWQIWPMGEDGGGWVGWEAFF